MKQTNVASSRKTANVHLNIIYNSEYKNEKDIKVMFFSIESRSVQKHLHWRQNVENVKIIFVDQNKDFKVAIPLRPIGKAFNCRSREGWFEEKSVIWWGTIVNHCQPLSTKKVVIMILTSLILFGGIVIRVHWSHYCSVRGMVLNADTAEMVCCQVSGRFQPRKCTPSHYNGFPEMWDTCGGQLVNTSILHKGHCHW